MIEQIKIPFNKPVLVGRELQYVNESLVGGHHSGDGPFTKRCQSELKKWTGAPQVLLVTSCTHALEMTAVLLNIGPGDEVIVPSFTFVSTVNAFVLRGALPVFCDIRADTLNLDEKQLPRLISPRTKAIVVVHYGGVGCNMDEILRISKSMGVPVVEDNAHGLFGKYKGRPLGSFGCLATQSFHETKNISCGEGGALLVNEPGLLERAEIIREKGTDRSKFFRGEVDKYTWVDLGSSYLLSDILAAHLFGQLEMASEIQEKRRKIWERYFAELGPWADKNNVQMPFVPQACDQAFHLFYMVLPNEVARARFISHLRVMGIMAVHHYIPLHSSPFARSLCPTIQHLPVTDYVSARLIRLPFYYALGAEEQGRVIEACKSFQFEE